MKLRNLRPGEWEIPDANLVVGDEPFEVDDELGKRLLEQEGNYERVDEKQSRSTKKDGEG